MEGFLGFCVCDDVVCVVVFLFVELVLVFWCVEGFEDFEGLVFGCCFV